MSSVLSNEYLVSRSNCGATKGSWDWAMTAGRCWVPRHDVGMSQDCFDLENSVIACSMRRASSYALVAPDPVCDV